jgi:hypothetical protein
LASSTYRVGWDSPGRRRRFTYYITHVANPFQKQFANNNSKQRLLHGRSGGAACTSWSDLNNRGCPVVSARCSGWRRRSPGRRPVDYRSAAPQISHFPNHVAIVDTDGQCPLCGNCRQQARHMWHCPVSTFNLKYIMWPIISESEKNRNWWTSRESFQPHCVHCSTIITIYHPGPVQ